MEKIGGACGEPIGGIYLRGTLENHGTPYKIKGRLIPDGYDTGIATFGNRKMPLYYQYNCDYIKGHEYYREHGNLFGAKDKSYTVALVIGEGWSCNIYNVKNNSGRVMYMLEHSGAAAGTTTYVLMAMTEDGKILKYIDTRNVLKDYFGFDKVSMKGPWVKDISVNGDSVRMKYEYPIYNQYKRKYDKKYGEFVFKWDEQVQWFSIDKIDY